MSTYTGNALPTVRMLENVDASSNINPMVRPDMTTSDRVLVVGAWATSAANTMNEPIAVSPALPSAQAAKRVSSYGDVFFERIHILPSRRAYQFVVSNQLLNVEVWNAYRETQQTVTNIIETGPAGVTILTPHATPILFYPLQSRIYQIQTAAAGAPRANNTIDFDFSGIPEPILVITGLRLLPFTISPNWDEPIEDDKSWLTDIMTSYDDTEQRMMLRTIPNRSLSYQASALEDREAGLLISLLWAWQARSYGVLLWMDGAPLRLDVVSGSLIINVDTTNMTLTPGVDTVIIISDAFNWFASPVTEVTPDTLTLDTPVDRDFFANGTQVVPVVLGSLADQVPVPRPTNIVANPTIKFDLSVVAPV